MKLVVINKSITTWIYPDHPSHIYFDLQLKRPPDEVLWTWHRIIAIGGGEVGVEVVHGEVDPCPAQRVRSAGLTRWVGGYY